MANFDASDGFQRLIDHYAAQSRWPEVKRYALERLKADPTDAVAHYWAAWASLQLGDLVSTEQHARALAAESADSWPTHLLWSELFLARGEVMGALAASRQALRVAPEVAACHHVLSRVHLRRGEHPQTLQAIDGALRLDPDNALYRLLHTIIQRIVTAAWSPASAVQEIATLQRVLALDPRNSWVLARIGKVYSTELFAYDQAVAYLRQSLEIDVSNAETRSDLQHARLRQDRLFRLMTAPLAQLGFFETDCPHWRVPWFVLPVVFYVMALVVAGAVFNLAWLWLPSQLYQQLVLTDLCRGEASYAWQCALYRRLACIPRWVRRLLWIASAVAYGGLLFVLLAIYAPGIFLFGILGCLSFAVTWRMRRNARRVLRKSELA